ncbi:hypothetical protein [Chimaeribacter arupi]|nr:hypothetical protein [Chimaeribacter arupi]
MALPSHDEVPAMKKAYFHYWGKARTPRTDGADAHKHVFPAKAGLNRVEA